VTGLAPPGMAYAEANQGRWIARCPRPWCDNAVQLWRGSHLMICTGDAGACGTVSPVVWPPDPVAIEAVLSMRPTVKWQSWLPGETVHDLLDENAVLGCLPPEWAELTERTVLAETVDGVVVAGLLAQALPAGREHPILTAGVQ
jgi:hypothetical protein